jgi:hypothetical protein
VLQKKAVRNCRGLSKVPLSSGRHPFISESAPVNLVLMSSAQNKTIKAIKKRCTLPWGELPNSGGKMLFPHQDDYMRYRPFNEVSATKTVIAIKKRKPAA